MSALFQISATLLQKLPFEIPQTVSALFRLRQQGTIASVDGTAK